MSTSEAIADLKVVGRRLPRVDAGERVTGRALYPADLKRPGMITYRFAEPIEPGLPRAEVEARVIEAINALNPALEQH